MEHYDLDHSIIMHNELQKAQVKTKTNKTIRMDKIPNEEQYLHIVTWFRSLCCLLAVYCTSV